MLVGEEVEDGGLVKIRGVAEVGEIKVVRIFEVRGVLEVGGIF